MTQEIVDLHQMYVNIANIVYDLSCFLYQGFHDSNEKLFISQCLKITQNVVFHNFASEAS